MWLCGFMYCVYLVSATDKYPAILCPAQMVTLKFNVQAEKGFQCVGFLGSKIGTVSSLGSHSHFPTHWHISPLLTVFLFCTFIAQFDTCCFDQLTVGCSRTVRIVCCLVKSSTRLPCRERIAWLYSTDVWPTLPAFFSSSIISNQASKNHNDY